MSRTLIACLALLSLTVNGCGNNTEGSAVTGEFGAEIYSDSLRYMACYSIMTEVLGLPDDPDAIDQAEHCAEFATLEVAKVLKTDGRTSGLEVNFFYSYETLPGHNESVSGKILMLKDYVAHPDGSLEGKWRVYSVVANGGLLPSDVETRISGEIGKTTSVTNAREYSAGVTEFDYYVNGSTTAKNGYYYKKDDILCPKAMTEAQLDKAQSLFKEWMEWDFLAGLQDDVGEVNFPQAEFNAALAAAKLTGCNWYPDEATDPWGLVQAYTVLFNGFHGTGYNYDLFMGYNPSTGDYEAYAFN